MSDEKKIRADQEARGQDSERYDTPELTKQQNLKKITKDFTFSIPIPGGP